MGYWFRVKGWYNIDIDKRDDTRGIIPSLYCNSHLEDHISSPFNLYEFPPRIVLVSGTFEHALQGYQEQTGTTLADDPFTGQLQECDSVESINAFLQGEAQALSKLTGSMKIARGCCVCYVFTFCHRRPQRCYWSCTSEWLMVCSASPMLAIQPFPPAQVINGGPAVLLRLVCPFLSSYVRILVTPNCVRPPSA